MSRKQSIWSGSCLVCGPLCSERIKLIWLVMTLVISYQGLTILSLYITQYLMVPVLSKQEFHTPIIITLYKHSSLQLGHQANNTFTCNIWTLISCFACKLAEMLLVWYYKAWDYVSCYLCCCICKHFSAGRDWNQQVSFRKDNNYLTEIRYM